MIQLEESFAGFLDNINLLKVYSNCIENLKTGNTIHYSQYTRERALSEPANPLFKEPKYTELNKILIQSFQQLSAMLFLPCNHLSISFKTKAKEIFTDYNGKLLTNAEYEELLKRFKELNLTIHQLLDTKICFIDTETTSLDSSRLPIQLAYMVVDSEFNYITSDNLYIEQEYIEPGASEVNGITVDKLKNELNAAQPTDALKKFEEIIDNYKPVFVAHNARFDRDTIINLYHQCSKEPVYSNMLFYCTFFNSSAFSSEKGKGAKKLSRLAEVNGIYDADVQTALDVIQLNIEQQNVRNAHDALYDVVMLYLLCKKVKLFGTPKD